MEKIKKILADQGFAVDEAELKKYLEELGIAEADLEDGLVAQIVDDILGNSKGKGKGAGALAKAGNNKPARGGSNKGAIAEPPQPPQQQPPLPNDIISGAVRAADENIQSFHEELEEGVMTYADYRAQATLATLQSTPNLYLARLAELSEQASSDPARFRGLARAGLQNLGLLR